MKTRMTYVLLVLVLFAAGPGHGQSAPAATMRDEVNFLTGGIGLNEQEHLRAREHEFNLKLVFTLVEGNYLSDVGIVVKDAAGKSLLKQQAEGPIFLAKLPAGNYAIEATYDGKTQTRKVKVGDRLRTEYLRWQSNPEADFPGPKATER